MIDDDPPDRHTDPPPVDTDALTTDTDTDAAVSAAEARARAVIAGTVPAEEGLRDVAWMAEGWPVRTAAGTFLFVHAAEAGSWSIAGTMNGWTPEPMTATNHGVWWAEVAVPEPDGASYKFVQDGTTYIADPYARAYAYDANGRIGYVRAPTLTAHLERWPAAEGAGLLPRDLRVWVPPGSGPWPTLYMHDGQNLFDPQSIFGGWKMDAAIASDGRDVLVVGIDNTTDRLDDYGHTTDVRDGLTLGGKGDAYAAFVADVVRPHVEAQYDTSSVRGVMGSSMGGLISLHIAHTQPGDWDFVGSLSGALWFGTLGADNPTMEDQWVGAPTQDIVVYLDSGGGDGGDGCVDNDGDGWPEDDVNQSDGYCMTRSLADALAGHGFTWDDDLFHWHEPGAAHNEVAWAARVGRPLGIFLDLAEP